MQGGLPDGAEHGFLGFEAENDVSGHSRRYELGRCHRRDATPLYALRVSGAACEAGTGPSHPPLQLLHRCLIDEGTAAFFGGGSRRAAMVYCPTLPVGFAAGVRSAASSACCLMLLSSSADTSASAGVALAGILAIAGRRVLLCVPLGLLERALRLAQERSEGLGLASQLPTVDLRADAGAPPPASSEHGRSCPHSPLRVDGNAGDHAANRGLDAWGGTARCEG